MKLAFVVCLLGPSLALAAQSQKLNGPLASAYLRDASSFDFAAGRVLVREGADTLLVALDGGAAAELLYQRDGSYTARLAPDARQVVLTGSFEAGHALLSLAVDGSRAPHPLGPQLGASQSLRDVQFSPDGQSIVFRVVDESIQRSTMYSARIDGSLPAAALNGPIFAYSIDQIRITPDSTRVLYRDALSKLRTVPLDGSAQPVVLARNRGGLQSYALAPDGSRVVYSLDCDVAGVFEVFAEPVDGSTPPVKLNTLMVAGGDAGLTQISADSGHVTYAADQETDGVQGLYGVPIVGGPVVRFAPGLAGRTIRAARVSPDGARMVYLANHLEPGRDDLFSVPIDGSQPPVCLTASLVGHVADDFLTDPISGRLLFRFFEGTRIVLYAVADDGSEAPWRLSPAGLTLANTAGRFALAADSRAVFLAEPPSSARPALYGAPLDGTSGAAALHPPLVAEGRVHSFQLEPSGQRVLYRAEQEFPFVSEVFVVPADGSAAPRPVSTVRQYPVTVGDVRAAVASPDGAMVIYAADLASEGDGVYRVDAEHPGESVYVAPSSTFQVTPDSRRLIYRTNAPYGLYSQTLDLGSAPILLAPAGFLDSLNVLVSPDSSRVVHRHQSDLYSAVNRLYSTPVLGGLTVELNAPFAPSGRIYSTQIAPDSGRVVWTERRVALGTTELYSAPLTGVEGPLKLNGALVTGGDVGGRLHVPPRISPDSRHVVYVADRDVDESLELYAVPIEGRRAPRELSELAGPWGDVTSFAFTPDSARLVYVADQESDDVFELYSLALDGLERRGHAATRARPIRLNAQLGPDQDVDTRADTGFIVSADSRWVVYRADQEEDEEYELYRVAAAGGAPPARLTPGLRVRDLLQITPGDGFVVFSAQATGSPVYRVALDGSSAPVLLSGDLQVAAPAVANERWVFFIALSPRVAGVQELFVAPLNGRSAPVAVGPLPEYPYYHGDYGGSFLPGADAILYLAERDEAGVVELYLRAMPTHGRPGHVR